MTVTDTDNRAVMEIGGFTVEVNGHVVSRDAVVESACLYETANYGDHRVKDAAWSGRDANGHWHAAVTKDDKVTYPTLETRERPCDGTCLDPEHTVTYYVCAHCHVEVTPGTRIESGGFKRYPVGSTLEVRFTTGDVRTARRFEGRRVHVYAHVPEPDPEYGTWRVFGMGTVTLAPMGMVMGEQPTVTVHLFLDWQANSGLHAIKRVAGVPA